MKHNMNGIQHGNNNIMLSFFLFVVMLSVIMLIDVFLGVIVQLQDTAST